MARLTTTVPTPLGNLILEAEATGPLEIRTGDLPTTLSNGMQVDALIAWVLFVEPADGGTTLSVSLRLDNPDIGGSPETGECLECLTWQSKDWALSVGTEDQDALNRRLPHLYIPTDPWPVDYSPSTITLHLRDLPMTNPTSFHFIVAYKRLPDERGCSTWFAADVAHDEARSAARTRSSGQR